MPRALISGSAGGIGRALAEGFLEAGCQVTGVDRAEPAWTAAGFDFVRLDLRDTAAVGRWAAGVERLDVLVNAAGVLRHRDEYDIAAFEEVVDINLTASMRLATALKPALAADGGGAVINIGSMYSFFGAAHAPGYAASKGAVVTLTKSLAVAWAADGIRVNAIAPGWIETPMTVRARSDADRNRAVLARTPMGRWGKPADLVGPVLFLASDAARFVTGVVLPVDGGYSAM